MSDAAWVAVWIAVLGTGLAAVVLLHRAGLRATYARDLLHIGTGVWVLGWPAWSHAAAPVALVTAAAVGTALVPVLAGRVRLLARFERSVSGEDERFGGLIWYTLAYAILTTAGLVRAPAPAAAGLWALSFGDGIGGAVGRRFGRHAYTVPWSKTKTFEGSATVAVVSAAFAMVAGAWFAVPVSFLAAAGIGVTAGLAEALAPRGTDNLIVPAVVWLVAGWVL